MPPSQERARILEISAFPPPRAGWSVRVEFLRKRLLLEGHECVVLNVGSSRLTPSTEYEMVLGGLDYARKVWRYSRAGFTVHAHVNGDSPKGFALALFAEALNIVSGRRPVLTFHAGVDQVYFPRHKSSVLVPMFKLMFALPRVIVCNTEAVKRRIVEYGVLPRKVVPIAAFSQQYLEFQRLTLPADIEAFYARCRVLFAYIRVRPGFDLVTLIEGFAEVASKDSSVGLLLVGVTEDVDADLWAEIQRIVAERGLGPRVCVVDELDHDRFRTALERSALSVRTPTSDGAASSVLESLVLGVPVVAAANGTRPPGVVTYSAGAPRELAAAVLSTLANRGSIVASMPRPVITDTLGDEVRLLTEG